jgi:phage shock protein A
MAGLIRQLTALFKTGLGTLLEPAEDPRETFTSPQQRQGELLTRVREALERNAALRKRLDNRIAQLQEKIPQLEDVARQAVASNRDDLARLALQQRQLAIIELKALEANSQEVQLEERRISILEQRLTAQVEAMRVRQEMTAVRYTAAESQVMVNEAIQGVSRELADLGQSIEQTEQKAEDMQARAFAIEQLADFDTLDLSGSATGDPLGQQLIQLELDKAVEEKLSALKKCVSD